MLNTMNFEDLFKKDEEIKEITKIDSDITDNDRLYVIKERQREKTFSEVMALYYRGKTYAEIERELSLSYAQIKYAIATVQNRLKDNTNQNYLARRYEQIERYRNIIREMWEAWDKSKKLDQKISIKRATMRVPPPNQQNNAQNQQNSPPNQPNRQEVEEQITETAGNIDYMKAIMWCEDRIAKLEGLEAPKKVAQTDTEGNNVRLVSARDEVLNALQMIADRNNSYNGRKNTEAIEAEIIREINTDINDINPKKPTKLLEGMPENEDN